MTAKSKRKSSGSKKASPKDKETTRLPASVEAWFVDNEEDVAAVREHNQTVPFYVPEQLRLLRKPGSRGLAEVTEHVDEKGE